MAVLLPYAKQQFADANGAPLSLGTVELFVPSTSTHKDSWQDAAQTQLNTNPIALDIGGYATIYGNGSYRQLVKDRLGNTIYDRVVDPVASGSVGPAGPAGPAGTGVGAFPATRTVMAGLATTGPAYLIEAGREGQFAFNSANLSAQVAADTRQGVYVAPGSDTTGASGAWVRRYSGPLDIRWFGAVADCTATGVGTDNAAAINGAIALANKIGLTQVYIPTGKWRVASRIVLTQGTQIIGDGFHENPGIAGGVTYSGINAFDGTILVYDAATAGIIGYSFTDNPNASSANASLTASGAASPEYKYKSASGTVIRDIMLYGGGGTTVTAHGIEFRTIVIMQNVRCQNFGGNGFHVDADTGGNGATTPYGVADGASFYRCHAVGNLCHGFFIRGNDANTITFLGCSSRTNGGVGYLDVSQLGNSYFLCHAATNNQSFGATSNARTQVVADASWLSDQYSGSYAGTSAVGAHTYTGCYLESGYGRKYYLNQACVVIGGNMASPSNAAAGSTLQLNLNGSGLITATEIDSVAPNGTLTFGCGTLNQTALTGSLIYKLNPQAGTYSELQMLSAGSLPNGLDILVGSGASYLSSNAFTIRNAAQSTTYATVDTSGVRSPLPTGGVGYSTGAGGTVTQATSKATGVTLNKVCGQITLNNASLAANTAVSFTLTNSTIAATDVVQVNSAGSVTPGSYLVQAEALAAGSCTISVRNLTAGALAEALVVNFAIIKAVAA